VSPPGPASGYPGYQGRSTRRPGPARWVLAGLLLLPVVELAVAIAVAGWIGVWPTIMALLVLSAIGFAVLRHQGRQAWQALSRASSTGQFPLLWRDPADVGLVTLAGVLLLFPGFLTGVVGLVLLVPPVRRLVRAGLGRVADRWPAILPPGAVVQGEVLQDDVVVRVEVVDETPKDPPQLPPAGKPADTSAGEPADRPMGGRTNRPADRPADEPVDNDSPDDGAG